MCRKGSGGLSSAPIHPWRFTTFVGSSTVFVRAFFTYRYEIGSRTLPWIRVGSRSVVTPRIPQTEMDVRALSHAQWIALRNLGFGGQLPTGERKRGMVWAKLGPDGWIVPLGLFVGQGGFRRRNGESNRVA
jgi:hypothetical protein